jgi:KUP system potassium uptake protein
MADGVFTPAVSVTSAVAGIGVAKPSVVNDVTPISIVILIVLFIGQRFGTARLAFLFAPGMFFYYYFIDSRFIFNQQTM